VRKLYFEKSEEVPHADGDKRSKTELYHDVAGELVKLHGNGAKATIGFQEIASVARFVADHIKEVPLGSPYFASQVGGGLDEYVSGGPSTETLGLPPIDDGVAGDNGLNKDGIESVATLAACYHLDRNLLVIRSVDRITELFSQGLYPINYGNAARTIDAYVWDAEDFLNEAGRNMVYGRVLGSANTEVSREVHPNRDYEGGLRRLIGSLVEDDRQRTVADLLETDRNRRPLALTSEQVRKAARDTMANASLYGWAGTQTNARKIKAQLDRALEILKLADVQRVYGVTSPWAVLERVGPAEFGITPNVLKFRTMAQSEFEILTILSKYVTRIDDTTTPLFARPGLAVVAIIPVEDETKLKVAAQNWVAVMGIQDDQVNKLSQPVDTASMPSIPSFTGSTNGKQPAPSADIAERLRQMFASGTPPTNEQVQQLLGAR
jgi:hypothetical protein